MCLIVWCKGRRMTMGEVNRAWNINPDGAGVAWAADGKVCFIRGIMKKKRLKKLLSRLSPPYVVHFRFATSGGVVPELTHPFPIGMNDVALEGTAKAVLFHNGVWSEWLDVLTSLQSLGFIDNGGRWSDTRLMSWLVSNSTDGYKVLRDLLIEKLLLLRADGTVYQSGQWESEDGVDWSNTYWKAIKMEEWDGAHVPSKSEQWVGYRDVGNVPDAPDVSDVQNVSTTARILCLVPGCQWVHKNEEELERHLYHFHLWSDAQYEEAKM